MADEKIVNAVEKILQESKKLKRKLKQNIDLVVNLKNIERHGFTAGLKDFAELESLILEGTRE